MLQILNVQGRALIELWPSKVEVVEDSLGHWRLTLRRWILGKDCLIQPEADLALSFASRLTIGWFLHACSKP